MVKISFLAPKPFPEDPNIVDFFCFRLVFGFGFGFFCDISQFKRKQIKE